MGTSSSFGGAGSNTPLLPSWADPPENGSGSPDNAPNDAQPSTGPASSDKPADTTQPTQNEPRLPIPPPASEENRFQTARANFSRWVSSGGTDRRALGRAVQQHVRNVSGGTGTAARRVSGSRRAATNLLGVLRDIQTRGVADTLRSLSLDNLIGRTPKEILAALTDVVCLPGGTIDEGIAREAYIETIVEVTESGVDLDALTEDQINMITIQFMSRSIVDRIINDAGQKLDVRALSGDQANFLVESLRDFVLGAVRDQLQKELQATRTLEKKRLNTAMTRIYEIAYELLETEANTLL